MWKGAASKKFRANRPNLCGNCAFPQNFRTRKLGEITVFYAEFQKIFILFFKSSRPEVFCKKVILKKFAKFTGKHLRAAALFKRDPNTGVFLWLLRNFLEHLFKQSTSSGCFYFFFLILTYLFSAFSSFANFSLKHLLKTYLFK